jgi:hypothetical protein
MKTTTSGVLAIRHAKLHDARKIALALYDKVTLLTEEVKTLKEDAMIGRSAAAQNVELQKLVGSFQELVSDLQLPIPMILFCPVCNERHIDKGKFAVAVHKSHSCQSCGFTWSPCHRPTVGVLFLPGYKDE